MYTVPRAEGGGARGGGSPPSGALISRPVLAPRVLGVLPSDPLQNLRRADRAPLSPPLGGAGGRGAFQGGFGAPPMYATEVPGLQDVSRATPEPMSPAQRYVAPAGRHREDVPSPRAAGYASRAQRHLQSDI